MQTPDNKPEDKIDEAAGEANVAVSSYAKYAGLAAQMGVTIALGVLLGQWLDKKWPLSESTPVYTVIFSLVGVGLALYSVLKAVISKQ